MNHNFLSTPNRPSLLLTPARNIRPLFHSRFRETPVPLHRTTPLSRSTRLRVQLPTPSRPPPPSGLYRPGTYVQTFVPAGHSHVSDPTMEDTENDLPLYSPSFCPEVLQRTERDLFPPPGERVVSRRQKLQKRYLLGATTFTNSIT